MPYPNSTILVSFTENDEDFAVKSNASEYTIYWTAMYFRVFKDDRAYFVYRNFSTLQARDDLLKNFPSCIFYTDPSQNNMVSIDHRDYFKLRMFYEED